MTRYTLATVCFLMASVAQAQDMARSTVLIDGEGWQLVAERDKLGAVAHWWSRGREQRAPPWGVLNLTRSLMRCFFSLSLGEPGGVSPGLLS